MREKAPVLEVDDTATRASPVLRGRVKSRESSAKRRWIRAGGTLACTVALGTAVVVPTYLSVPQRNNIDPEVDCLLVLGSPTEIDGTLTQAQRWRVDEAVREWRAGRAPRILFTGGVTSRNYTESATMAAYALQSGVPGEAIFQEPHARTTVENIRDSEAILEVHGWRRVEVISSPEHLPRAALLLAHSDLLWQTHAAATPGRSPFQRAGAYTEEALGTTIMKLCGPRIEPVLHGVATVQHRAAFAFRWLYYRAKGRLGRAGS